MAETTVDGVRVVVAGQCRHAFDIAQDFVREQSEGEWDDDMIKKDASKLASLMLAFSEARSLNLSKPVEG